MLGILLLFSMCFDEISNEICFFSCILFFYPALAIEMSQNEVFSKSEKRIIQFLNKMKVSSRILFGLWLFFGIGGSGFVIADMLFCLSLLAVFFLLPAVIIEWRSNPLLKTTREVFEARKKESADIRKRKKEQRCVEAKYKKEEKLRLRKQAADKRRNANFEKSKSTASIQKKDRQEVSKTKYSKDIERENKESVNRLIRENNQRLESISEETKDDSAFENLKELEKQNKELVYQLIKGNRIENKQMVLETNNKDYVEVVIESDRLAQDYQERINQGEKLYSNMTWGRVNKKRITKSAANSSSEQMKSKPVVPVKSEKELLEELLNEIDIMDGHKFEYFCADLLRENGYVNVKVTRGSGDQGADIIAEKGEFKYAIQCKRFHNVLNNKSVQEVSGGRAYYHCDIGVVLTNSHFNTHAKDLASATGILLWDRAKLIELIKSSGRLKVKK